MEITELKNQIQTKQLQTFYIFSGVEWKVQRLYLEQMSKVSGKELKYIDSITDIYGKLKSSSLLARSYIYVVRDDKEIMQNEKLQAQLETMLKNNVLVLILTIVDKRLKFYKQYKDTIIEFEPLKPMVLKKYIQKEIHLSDKSCDKLMEVCEYDYGRCLLEIDKIKHYVESYNDGSSNETDPSQVFEWLLKDGTIYQPPKDAIFDFVDAVLDGKVNLAFNLYQQCLAVGEATMVMISVLYTNARAVLQVQSCHSGDVAKVTGLTGWQIMNAKKHLKVFKDSELVNILDICQRCQQGIVTGTIEEEFVMDYILTNIF